MESEMGLISQRVTVNTFQLHGGKGIQYSCIVSTGVNTGLHWYLGDHIASTNTSYHKQQFWEQGLPNWSPPSQNTHSDLLCKSFHQTQLSWDMEITRTSGNRRAFETRQGLVPGDIRHWQSPLAPQRTFKIRELPITFHGDTKSFQLLSLRKEKREDFWCSLILDHICINIGIKMYMYI